MPNQPDKRQQFRFWLPFWGNASTNPSRTPASAPRRPSPTNQPKPRSATQTPAPPTPPIKRTTSRTPSPSPSPSSRSSSSSPSPSPSSSPAKQNQPRRVSRIPSSPLPSQTQSPSRRSSRLDQDKQKKKDIDAEKSLEASNQQGTKQDEKMFEKEPIEPNKAQDHETIDDKPTSQAISNSNSNVEKENGSKDLEKLESRSIPFDPLNSDKPKPTETVIPNKNPTETETVEQNGPQNHEPKPQLELDMNRQENEIIKHGTSEQVSKTEVPETQLEENKQTQNEPHHDHKSIPDMNHQENEITKDHNLEETKTIKEIEKPIQDANPKETIKEITQPSTSDVHHLSSNNQTETHNSTNNNNINHSDNEDRETHNSTNNNNNIIHSDNEDRETHNSTNNNNNVINHSDNEDRTERENPSTHNPKRKAKIVASPSSTRVSFQKDIKDGISKLIQKINSDNQFNPGSDTGTSILTLAGENKGASMYIGPDENEEHHSTFTGRARNNGKDKIETKNDEEDSNISANVNSNVQSINNSVLRESKCDTRDPGVHLRVSSIMKKEKLKKREG